MATKPTDLVYGVDDVPPLPRLFALGLQYAILLSVYLILVVLVARAAGLAADVTTDLVSFALIAAAAGTRAPGLERPLLRLGLSRPAGLLGDLFRPRRPRRQGGRSCRPSPG